jgi:hypothetical protein
MSLLFDMLMRKITLTGYPTVRRRPEPISRNCCLTGRADSLYVRSVNRRSGARRRRQHPKGNGNPAQCLNVHCS